MAALSRLSLLLSVHLADIWRQDDEVVGAVEWRGVASP
jgi:hypothetical protein